MDVELRFVAPLPCFFSPRPFDQDAIDNRAYLAAGGKLTMPILAVGGEKSFGRAMAATLRGATFYDSSGRTTGRASTDSSGTTTFRDSSGRVTGRSTTTKR